VQRLTLGDVAHRLNALDRLDLAQEVAQLRGRWFLLQVDDHADPIAPLIDGAPEVQREEPEAAQRRQRKRDEEDRAHTDPPGPAEVPQRLGDDEAEHHPSSFSRWPPARVRVRRMSWVATRARWVARNTV